MALAEIGNSSQGRGIAFLVSAGIVYEIIAANCSSPQTTELNADRRAETLMKYVNLGLGQAAVFVVAAACFDRGHAGPIIAGGVLAGVIMWALYGHAKNAGLASSKPGTEQYG
jgi:hypothetical protein